MKKFTVLLFALASILTLSACGDVLVDLDTPKSEELSAQYDFYSDSMNTLRGGMGITPEEADEVFIVLVACGVDSEITSVNASGEEYRVWRGLKSVHVALDGGVVVEVRDGGNILYPEQDEPDEEGGQDEEEPDAPDAGEMTLQNAVESAIEAAGAEVIQINIYGGFVSVQLQGKDNLTTNMIRNGVLIEACDIMEALQGRDDLEEIYMSWSFPTVDSYGNTGEVDMFGISFEKETLGRINFDNFIFGDIPDIADEYYEHPAMSD